MRSLIMAAAQTERSRRIGNVLKKHNAALQEIARLQQESRNESGYSTLTNELPGGM